MEAEATPFIEHLQLEKLSDFFPSHLPFVAYRGIYQTTTLVTLITNGKDTVYTTEACNVGTIAAATITMMALQQQQTQQAQEYPPFNVYINAGTAGGFQRNGATIGDIYVISSFAFHDRRIPIPGYDTYGMGKSTATINVPAFLQHLNQNNSTTDDPNQEQPQPQHRWKTGICSTGDSLDKTTECDAIMEQHNASVKDMEASAIAWVVSMYKDIKFGSIKVVTDIVDGTQPTQEEFMANLQTASEQLQYALPMVLDYIATTEIDQL
jgi:5'-methylthioadenosine nucleosidase